MYKIFTKVSLLLLFLVQISVSTSAQTQQRFTSQQFRLAERIIRIAEPGQLADSVNIWGDVGSAGRYVIPKGTNLTKLISYSFGPRTLRDGQTELDWSKMRVEINIQEYSVEDGVQGVKKFRYRFEDPIPEGMSDFVIKNNQTITVRVKRKASFRDYVQVIAPVISALATTIIAFDRVRN